METKNKLIIFTFDFPYGNSEQTFIKYELSQLVKEFDSIHIVNKKKEFNKIKQKNYSNIFYNDEFSKQLNLKNLFFTLISKIIFTFDYWIEVKNIFLSKKFFIKLKMLTLEQVNAKILHDFIFKNFDKNDNYIFYSFWSNFVLITFNKIKKDYPNSKFIARGLGSDLNGFIINDDYIPNVDKKFNKLDNLILLGEYQKEILERKKLKINKINICPIGVYKQNILDLDIDLKNQKIPLNFVSCGNLIEIKNNLLMIDFLLKFKSLTNRKINYTLIGNGKMENKIIDKLKKNQKFLNYKHIDKVDNLIEYFKNNRVNFFMNFSSQEGMAFTIMEAMSCGIPIIASNIKPNKFLINGRGYLFDIYNFDQSISTLIKDIDLDLESKDNYLIKSKNCYEFINKNLVNEDCFQEFKKVLLNV